MSGVEISVETGRVLIVVGVGLAVLGLVMLWASRARGVTVRRGRTRIGRGPVVGLAVALTCTALTGGVIAGVQWAILGQSGSGAVWMVALGLPALLAGATMTRLIILIGPVVRRAHLVRRGGHR